MLLFILFPSNPACAARRVIKKKVEVPSPWFGNTDVTYSNWLKDKWEGGGETRVGGLQLGLSLPYGFSTFARVSVMPAPYGLQDVRTGLSKSFVISPALRNTLSSSFSIPTSEYSRSISQKTQASLASTQEFYLNALTLSFTGYGAQAYYNDDGAIPPSTSFLLARKNRNKHKKRRPSSRAPRTAGDFAAENFLAEESIAVDYGDLIYLTRFDYLWGGALDFTYRLTSEWAVNSAGSLTRSTFSTKESIWTADITLLQISYAYHALSLFAATGLLDSAPLIRWPTARTYTVGTSYNLFN
jgi:hypothetical protein